MSITLNLLYIFCRERERGRRGWRWERWRGFGGRGPVPRARGGGGDRGAGAGRVGVRHRALLQQVGENPHAGALPTAVPLPPRHRQARTRAAQRRPRTLGEVYFEHTLYLSPYTILIGFSQKKNPVEAGHLVETP